MSVAGQSLADPLSVAEELLSKNASIQAEKFTENPMLKPGSSVRLPLWFTSNESFSLDFSVKTTVERPSTTLSSFPTQVQERILLKELINCMTGVNGQYISIAGCDGKLVYDVDSTADPALREITERCLSILTYYSNISSFLEKFGWYETGMINQSLVSGIRETFEDYLLFVGQLESQYLCGTLTLQRMFYFVEQIKPVLLLLDSVCTGVRSSKAFGGKTLQVLQHLMDSCDGQNTAITLLNHLTCKASVPLFRMVQNWISHGVICDPFGEFFVNENKKSTENMDIFPEACWEKQFTLRDDMIPPTLETFKKKILDTGKYINVLRECGTTYDFTSERELIYSDGINEYGKIIEDAYRFSSRMVVDVLLNKFNLADHLKSMKRFFLVENGDFATMFLDLAEEELAKPKNETWTSRLQTLVDLAIQSSSCQVDPNAEFIRAEIKQSFHLQLLRVLSFERNTDSSRSHIEIEEGNPSVFEVFSLNMDVKWPLNIVTNQRVILSYQLLFRHLFYCKLIEHQLCNVWIGNKFLKHCALKDARWYAMVFALRNRMLAFVQNLIHYTTIEVIEPHWRNFEKKLRKVQTLGEVLTLHHEFLAACLTDSLLLNIDFCKQLYKLLGACVVFTNHIKSISESTVEMPISVPSQSTTVRMRLAVTGKILNSRLHDLAVDPEFQLMVSQKEVEFRQLFGAFLHSLTKDPTAAGGRLVNIIQRYGTDNIILDETNLFTYFYFRMDYNGFYSDDVNLYPSDSQFCPTIIEPPNSTPGNNQMGQSSASVFDLSAVSSLQSDP